MKERTTSIPGPEIDHNRSTSPSLPPRTPDSRRRSSGQLQKILTRDRTHRDDASSGKEDGRDQLSRNNAPALSDPAEIALAALQYLPTPTIVLDSLKTVLVANEAMGRLLGLRDNTLGELYPFSADDTVTEILRGQSLSQIGLDMISDGAPIWVDWQKFLDKLVTAETDDEVWNDDPKDTPTTTYQPRAGYLPRDRGRSPVRDRSLIRDTVVDVVVSSHHVVQRSLKKQNQHHPPKSPSLQTHCRMIVSTWRLDDQQYFTLTFTSSGSTREPPSPSHILPHTSLTKSRKSSYSRTPSSSRSSSAVASPSETSFSPSNFPPNGAPAKCITTDTPSVVTDLQKITRMKDAMLNAMHIPVVAMWKDESVVFPNAAARRLLAVYADATSEDSYDFRARFRAYTSDFEHELEEEDSPIVRLCRTQKAFEKWEVGYIDRRTGKRFVFDVSGYPVFDEKTGEFFAGLCAFKDVTEYTEKIATQTQHNEQQFQLICDSMPQMLWTTKPDGHHDYFSQRWYDYTGLKPEECIGLNWTNPFHPDDMAETSKRWVHSLATGHEYLTQYRCRRHDGQWRWMLGRALPLRDHKTGEIVKWYGTCTDIQDVVDAQNVGKRSREQLLEVLGHAEMTMWTIDRSLTITFFEGDVVPGLNAEQLKERNTGMKITDAFRGAGSDQSFGNFEDALQRILNNKSSQEILESAMKDRWFRTRLLPLKGRRGPNGVEDHSYIDGVIGISTDVTKMKQQEQENIRLLANESAAKEASKMKSNFLANMSHEIRTPIAGVLGMSELLMDTLLDKEQMDFASNIQRSANSLLTVINDILDFSKIESGRLDMEEVQFSLCVVLRDVAKMLSFAAERKNLQFISDMQLGSEDADLTLLGDPGRVRQILTNLLTNSIKFTSDGYVKMTAKVILESADSTTVQFQVADTGIGIEEEVKKKLFRPFSQADSSTARRFGGTGLGLTISKNLVDLMHGSITLESKLDQGTVATFTIPFKRPEYAAGGNASLVDVASLPERLQSDLSCRNSSATGTNLGLTTKSPPPSPAPGTSLVGDGRQGLLGAGQLPDRPHALTDDQRHSLNILVVEDNPVNQQIALRFLNSLKFSVKAVWNGREALDYLQAAVDNRDDPEHPLPSVILMDVQMPVLDGYHATHILRHHSPYKDLDVLQKIPIVAMTASAIQGDREKCTRAGMDDYLAKPVKRTTLEKMILKWTNGDGKLIPRRPVHKMDSTASFDTSWSDKGVCNDRPGYERMGTDHSSNCPGAEMLDGDNNTESEPISIAADLVPTLRTDTITVPTLANTQLMPEDVSQVSSTTQIPRPGPSVLQYHGSGPSPSLHEARKASFRRSSLSKTILASSLPGAQSEADHVARRAEAEERASSLRDAKLIAATEPPPGLSPPVDSESWQSLKVASAGDINLGIAGSPLPRSYPDQGGPKAGSGEILKLTEANLSRLNDKLDDDLYRNEDTKAPTASSKKVEDDAAEVNDLPSHASFGEGAEWDDPIVTTAGLTAGVDTMEGLVARPSGPEVNGSKSSDTVQRIGKDDKSVSAGPMSGTTGVAIDGPNTKGPTIDNGANNISRSGQHLRPTPGHRQESTWSNSTARPIDVPKADCC